MSSLLVRAAALGGLLWCSAATAWAQSYPAGSEPPPGTGDTANVAGEVVFPQVPGGGGGSGSLPVSGLEFALLALGLALLVTALLLRRAAHARRGV